MLSAIDAVVVVLVIVVFVLHRRRGTPLPPSCTASLRPPVTIAERGRGGIVRSVISLDFDRHEILVRRRHHRDHLGTALILLQLRLVLQLSSHLGEPPAYDPR